MKNAFGVKNYEIKDLICNNEIAKKFKPMFLNVLTALGIPKEDIHPLIENLYELAHKSGSVLEYERAAHDLLIHQGFHGLIQDSFLGRSKIIYNHVSHLIQGQVILDLGCGDGKIGELLSQDGYSVTLADIYKHPNVEETQIPFVQYAQGELVPLPENAFDTTLLLMVLHHTDDPMLYIREASRVTKIDGRVLLIESVYGVTGKTLTAEQRIIAKHYLSLSGEEQRMVNIFFDHFFNRIFCFNDDPKKKVNVPFNFNTPENWETLFKQNGFQQEQIIELGLDLPTVPEYHTLHMFKKLS